MSYLILIWSIFTTLSHNGNPDIYFTWTGERIPCKFWTVDPQSINIENDSTERLDFKKILAKDIKGYRHNNEVLLSMRIVNDNDSTYVFLPFKKPFFDYKYLCGDSPGNNSELSFVEQFYRASGWSNGKLTFYRLEKMNKRQLGGGTYDDRYITRKNYRLFVDLDKKGLSELNWDRHVKTGQKSEVYELISEYFADKPTLIEKFKATLETNPRPKNIEKFMEEYFDKTL